MDVFRRADACPDVAREAVEAGAKAVWLQLGLVSPEARRIAEDAGLEYVEDDCTAIVHRARDLPSSPSSSIRRKHEVADRDEVDKGLLDVHEHARVVLITAPRTAPRSRGTSA